MIHPNEKILHINPHQKTSLQTHKKRSEKWHVISGTCTVTIGNDVYRGDVGSKFLVPIEIKHRIEAHDEPVEIHEQFEGIYDEDDVIRLEDIYGR